MNAESIRPIAESRESEASGRNLYGVGLLSVLGEFTAANLATCVPPPNRNRRGEDEAHASAISATLKINGHTTQQAGH